MGKEIEAKFEINIKTYNNLLNHLHMNAKFKNKIEQNDIYYSPDNVDYYAQGIECLRIRIEGELQMISYKKIHENEYPNRYIEEYETKIEDYNMMEKILESVGFKQKIVVQKKRIEFMYNDDFIIALDEVENLGYFVEVENMDLTHDDKIRNEELIKLCEKLDLDISKQNFEGYSNMLYRKSKFF